MSTIQIVLEDHEGQASCRLSKAIWHLDLQNLSTLGHIVNTAHNKQYYYGGVALVMTRCFSWVNILPLDHENITPEKYLLHGSTEESRLQNQVG